MTTIVWLTYFIFVSFLSSYASTSEFVYFSLSGVFITMDAMPSHWAFYFGGSGLPLSSSGTWSNSICEALLQKLQTVVLMLYRIVFHLSGKMAALHLCNSTARAYTCYHGGTVSLFLF